MCFRNGMAFVFLLARAGVADELARLNQHTGR